MSGRAVAVAGQIDLLALLPVGCAAVLHDSRCGLVSGHAGWHRDESPVRWDSGGGIDDTKIVTTWSGSVAPVGR
jgi:hypothetical protein